MDGQMDEGQQHQGGLSPPPLAHFFPIREGGRDESCIFEGICFQMLFFSSDATTYLAREKISKWQLYQQKRSAGRWSKGNGETIHKELKERVALNKWKQRSLFPQPPRRLPSVPHLSWLTTIVHSSLKSIKEYSLCSRYYAWCSVCRWQDRGTVFLKCAITWRRQTQRFGVLGRRGAEALSCPLGEGRDPRQPPTLPPPQQWRSYLASLSHSKAAPQEKHDPPGHFLLGHLPIQQWGWIEWSFPFWEETIKTHTYIRNSSGDPVVRTLRFHCWWPWVQSLVGKLRFIPQVAWHSQTKNHTQSRAALARKRDKSDLIKGA